ncbi:tyrosine-type recombinase/integrase [Caproiciproducens sp. LBM24188]
MNTQFNTLTDHDTFHQWGEFFIQRKKGKVSPSQIRSLQCYLKHAYNFFGDMPLNKIKTDHIDYMLDSLTECNPNTKKPASHQLLIDVRGAISSVFELAIDKDAVIKNPARKREISKFAPKSERRALTLTEQKLIVSTPHRARIGALIMMLAGLRKGELIPLTWDDINLDDFYISITKSVEEKTANHYIVKNGTKNGKWGRNVGITVDLALEIQKAKETAKSKYVCCKTDGTMHTATSWRRMWSNYIKTIIDLNPSAKQTGINEITAHYLRHTYATLLYISDVDLETACKLLGHSNIKTTLAIYTHLQETMVIKSVDKLDSYISKTIFDSSI